MTSTSPSNVARLPNCRTRPRGDLEVTTTSIPFGDLGDRLYLPHVVVAELFAGAFKSERLDHHRAIVETFLGTVTPLASNIETAKIYGRVWASLATADRMIPHNDIWIAALCLQHEMPLVTEDAHFAGVDGLVIERW